MSGSMSGWITCTWMRRDRGRLPKLTEVVVSPEAAAHFKIEAPCVLDKERALRIIKWMDWKKRGLGATDLSTVR